MIDELIHAAELTSDCMDRLQVPHIFITLKNEMPYAVFFSTAGTLTQSIFLAITALIKTLEMDEKLRPALAILGGILGEIKKRYEEKDAGEICPESTAGMEETFKEVFAFVKENEPSKKQD